MTRQARDSAGSRGFPSPLPSPDSHTMKFAFASRRRAPLIFVVASLIVAACSGGEPSGPPTPKSLTVTADTNLLLVA